MPKFVSLTDKLYLVEQEIKQKKIVKQRGTVNHIWIYDRSGSMHWLLPELTNQLIHLSKKLPKNDTLTLGWFSGEGDYNWVFKGFKITDTSDYKMLEQAIRNNASSRNTTCFSEVLSNINIVIKDLSIISKTFALHFFTDGYPVVNNYRKEMDDIFNAIKIIRGNIQSAMFVGYGSYYNKELLTQMAEKLGALLIHSSLIPEYSEGVTRLVKLTENQESKEEVEALVENPVAVFTVTDQGIVLYSLDEETNKLYINPQKGKNTKIYYITNEGISSLGKKNWRKVYMENINFSDEADELAKALYSSILVLTQKLKTDLSLEVAGKIGDKDIVDSLNNAFTVEEYGRAEEKINNCIEGIVDRFASGRDSNYLPPENAFCVFDLLNMLMDDKDSAFFPFHEGFKYEKVSVSTKNKEGYAKFQPNKASKCYFNDLVWHKSRLNLNVQTRINGTIELDQDKAKQLNLSNPYETYVFRNYTFIKDGLVHIKKFYVTTSDEVYKQVKNKGIVFDDQFANSGIYGIDLSVLPAINRSIANGKTSATDLCKMILVEKELKAKVKSFKWLKTDELGEDAGPVSQTLTTEQVAFLEEIGIKADTGLYSPPVELEEAKDKYLAKSFEIKVKGLSSLPAVQKVMDKIASKKECTPVEQLIEKGIKEYNIVKTTLKTADLKQVWFDTNIKELRKELNVIRSSIAETKFAVMLGKKWFDEFENRDESELEVDDKKYKFELKEEVVAI